MFPFKAIPCCDGAHVICCVPRSLYQGEGRKGALHTRWAPTCCLSRQQQQSSTLGDIGKPFLQCYINDEVGNFSTNSGRRDVPYRELLENRIGQHVGLSSSSKFSKRVFLFAKTRAFVRVVRRPALVTIFCFDPTFTHSASTRRGRGILVTRATCEQIQCH
jgi:hypothetical protein